MRETLRQKTAFEKTMYALLLGALGLSVAVIALVDPDGAAPPAERAQTQTASESRSELIERPGGEEGVQPCAALGIPLDPPDPVTCRSRTATLTIAAQADPVLLGDTHVRLLRARLRDSALFARLRVRNETGAEQGVAAGGQELYINVAGVRIDPRPVRDIRVAPATGVTTDVVFNVPARQRAAIRGAGGRFELGVTPWTDGTAEDRTVGVIRAQLES